MATPHPLGLARHLSIQILSVLQIYLVCIKNQSEFPVCDYSIEITSVDTLKLDVEMRELLSLHVSWENLGRIK